MVETAEGLNPAWLSCWILHLKYKKNSGSKEKFYKIK